LGLREFNRILPMDIKKLAVFPREGILKNEDGTLAMAPFAPGVEPDNGCSIGGTLPIFPHTSQEDDEEAEVAVVIATIREHIGKPK
jgi:hypothetical protein